MNITHKSTTHPSANTVTHVFEQDGELITVSGQSAWTVDQALGYVARRHDVRDAFAACVASADNFIGQSFRATFGAA